jgi:hypothetical protein
VCAQNRLGHANINTTAHYLQSGPEEQKEVDEVFVNGRGFKGVWYEQHDGPLSKPELAKLHGKLINQRQLGEKSEC